MLFGEVLGGLGQMGLEGITSCPFSFDKGEDDCNLPPKIGTTTSAQSAMTRLEPPDFCSFRLFFMEVS